MAEMEDGEGLGEDLDILAKVSRWDKDLERHWGEWVKETKECYRFVAGHQYSKTELDKLEEDNKPSAVFNRIGPIIDAVVGAQIQGRQEVRYFPVEIGDSGVNEMLTRGAEWIRDKGDAESEESVAFRDNFVCGVGWVECRMDFDDDPKGKVVYDRQEPWTVLADPSSRKANFMDARYIRWQRDYSREEFEELWPGKTGEFEADEGAVSSRTSDPKKAYKDESETRNDDLVTVSLYQWYETETIVLVPSADGTTLVPVPAEDFEELREAAEEAGQPPPIGQTVRQRRYRFARVTGKVVLDKGELEQKKFTLQAVTGKRDEDKGTYYGLVRSMKDPQVWANTFFNMLLHIIRTNAKGGLMLENGAVEDMRAFEASWAKSDSISWLEDGAIANKRVMPKPSPNVPGEIGALLEKAVEAIRETSGVSMELLGLADRDQPGVLEAQRKQAAYGILAPYFESFKRYRKLNGELLLDYMPRMQGQLIRITKGTGVDKYLPLIVDPDLKYDVIVDEAPAGPNQKQQTFAIIQAMLPLLARAELPTAVWVKLLEYSPLPQSLVGELSEALMQAEQGDPQQEIVQQIATELGLQGQAQQVRKTAAEAEQKEVETVISIMSPDPKPQVVT